MNAPTFPAADYNLLPPVGFRVVGAISSVQRTTSPPRAIRSPGTSRAQKAGKRYEKKVLAAFQKLEPTLEVGPWFHFMAAGRRRYCQPDAVLETVRSVFIFEVKIVHSDWAYWQLKHLYAPVLTRLYTKPVRLVEITRSFDPHVKFGCEMRLHFDWEPLKVLAETLWYDGIEVLQWKV